MPMMPTAMVRHGRLRAIGNLGRGCSLGVCMVQTVSTKASDYADCQNCNEWFVHSFLSYAVVLR